MSLVHVLVVTHGGAGAAMVAAVERLLGPDAVAGFETLECVSGEPKGGLLARITEAVDRLDDGSGVVIAIDMFGSTPSNCAVEISHVHPNVPILGGVNLPMLVKLATAVRIDTTAEALARAAFDTAVKSIRLSTERES